VVCADMVVTGQHAPATEDRHFEIGMGAAGLEDGVDLLFYRRAAVTRRAFVDVLPGVAGARAVARQHEMIHAAYPQARIADARRHARAEHGVDHLVLAGDVVVAGQELCDDVARRVAIATNPFEAGQRPRHRGLLTRPKYHGSLRCDDKWSYLGA